NASETHALPLNATTQLWGNYSRNSLPPNEHRNFSLAITFFFSLRNGSQCFGRSIRTLSVSRNCFCLILCTARLGNARMRFANWFAVGWKSADQLLSWSLQIHWFCISWTLTQRCSHSKRKVLYCAANFIPMPPSRNGVIADCW